MTPLRSVNRSQFSVCSLQQMVSGFLFVVGICLGGKDLSTTSSPKPQQPTDLSRNMLKTNKQETITQLFVRKSSQKALNPGAMTASCCWLIKWWRRGGGGDKQESEINRSSRSSQLKSELMRWQLWSWFQLLVVRKQSELRAHGENRPHHNCWSNLKLQHLISQLD